MTERIKSTILVGLIVFLMLGINNAFAISQEGILYYPHGCSEQSASRTSSTVAATVLRNLPKTKEGLTVPENWAEMSDKEKRAWLVMNSESFRKKLFSNAYRTELAFRPTMRAIYDIPENPPQYDGPFKDLLIDSKEEDIYAAHLAGALLDYTGGYFNYWVDLVQNVKDSGWHLSGGKHSIMAQLAGEGAQMQGNLAGLSKPSFLSSPGKFIVKSAEVAYAAVAETAGYYAESLESSLKSKTVSQQHMQALSEMSMTLTEAASISGSPSHPTRTLYATNQLNTISTISFKPTGTLTRNQWN